MQNSCEPLITKITRLFKRDLAAENDFLRAENRVLRELIPDSAEKVADAACAGGQAAAGAARIRLQLLEAKMFS